jgi:hypothetical protein
LLLAGGSIEVDRIGDRVRVNSDGEEIVAQAVDEETNRGVGDISSEETETRV